MDKLKTEKTIITIDGPAGAGKSTVAKLLAAKLNYVYVDTGALYRSVAFEITDSDTDYKDKKELNRLLNSIDLRYEIKNSSFILMCNGNDISQKIRTDNISMLASKVSAIPEVRSALLGIQHRIGRKYDSVFEGRDMGTVVFPNARFKFFLIADLKTRAKRRFGEYSEKKNDQTPDLGSIEKDMEKRDHADSTRKESPLKPASDSIIIDSTDLSVQQVVEKINGYIEIS